MDVSWTPVSEVTDGVRLQGTYTPGDPVFNFKLVSTGNDVIYLRVPKVEVAGLLKQLTAIMEG